jgi:hypothetical protein
MCMLMLSGYTVQCSTHAGVSISLFVVCIALDLKNLETDR